MQEDSAKKKSLFSWVTTRSEQKKAKPTLIDRQGQQSNSKGIADHNYYPTKPSGVKATAALTPTSRPFRDPPITLAGHSDLVFSVAFSPSGQLLASASKDRSIRLWNTISEANIATLEDDTGSVRSVAFSPDGGMLASSSWDVGRLHNMKLWDVESRAQIATLDEHTSLVVSVEFSPDGALMASGSHDNTVRLWDVRSRNSISRLEGHSNVVESVAFSPDGKVVASGSQDNTIRLWDVASRATTTLLKGHSEPVKSVAFSPTGEHLASGSWDTTIRFWSVATGAHTATMRGHSDRVRSLAFSPNSTYLISGSYDTTVRLWDVASASQISTLQSRSSYVNCVAFSPTGASVASGSWDSTVRLWRDPSEELEDPRRAIVISDPGGLTQSTISIQQHPINPASISFPLNTDITGSVTLQGSTAVGYGGFGDLFLGTHSGYGKVAMKKPRRVLDEALVRRFLREVNLWCSVSHPHILPCLGMCKIGLDVYVVSPFIENGDLLSCMARGMDLNRTKLLFEVAEALTHLHHRGIVHGDVKAQNILLGDDGSALLCDFGMAKAFDTMVTSTESKGAGSLRWMPPELFLGEGRSMASDVYSLGITIAEVLSGRAPFHDIMENVAVMFHIVSRDGRPPKVPSHSSEGKSYATLWATAEKCWAKDPKDRPYMAQVLAMLFPLTREVAR